MKQVYKGRRISTGSAMPAEPRDETVSALVETVAWAYNCQVRAANLPPRITVRNLLFPVRQSYIVGRVPREKELARRGVLEGPVMGVCCRVETSFHDHPDGHSEGGTVERWKEILDLAREVGVMLLLAQERSREAKQEIKAGEGKWWTTTRRWGGGPGGLMGNDLPTERQIREDGPSTPGEHEIPEEAVKQDPANQTTKTSEPAEASCVATATAAAGVTTSTTTARPKRKASLSPGDTDHQSESTQHKKGGKATQADRWKKLRPGPGVWDRKMKYMKIGAPPPQTSPPPGSQPPSANEAGKHMGAEETKARVGEDEVFLVSAINHHVALLSMRVSSRYLRWLAGEDDEEEESEHAAKQGQEQGQGQGLQLKRTRWFDLFDEADRVEFVEGLWQVMGWLMREKK